MKVGRRKALKLCSGLAAASTFAGCNYFSDSRDTTIYFLNKRQEPQSIGLTVLDPEADSRSSLFREQFDVEGVGESSDNTQRFEGAFETQKSVVEVATSTGTHQFLYFPGCPKEEGNDVLSISLEAGGHQIDWGTGCVSN